MSVFVVDQEEWVLVLSELLGMPARTMGMLAEAGQQAKQAAGTGDILGLKAMAGFVMGLGDMAEMALGGHKDVLEAQRKAEVVALAAATKRKEASRLTFSFEVTVQGLAGNEQVSMGISSWP